MATKGEILLVKTKKPTLFADLNQILFPASNTPEKPFYSRTLLRKYLISEEIKKWPEFIFQTLQIQFYVHL